MPSATSASLAPPVLYLFGINPIFGLLAFTTVSGAGIAVLGSKASHRDVEIGTVLAFMLGLGVLFLAYYNGFASEAYSILFGEIVGISTGQVEFTLATAIPVLVALGLVYRQLLFASLDEEVAEAKGMHTLLLGLIFMLSLAVAISIAVTIIGVLLIFALTVTPAAIAIRLAKRPLYAVILAVLVALGAMWAGIFIGFYSNKVPTSFFIVTIVFVTYILVRVIPLLPRFFHWLKSERAPKSMASKSPSVRTAVLGEPTGETDTA